MNSNPHCRVALLAAIVFAAISTAQHSGAEPSTPPCISWSTSVRYRGIGYDHLVDITSRCEQAADCRVSTDVNPEDQAVEVPAGQTVEVVTFVASPAREFRARVACVLRAKE